MKIIHFFLLVVFCLVALSPSVAQQCSDYTCLIKKVEKAIKDKKYRIAFDNLEAADGHPNKNIVEIAKFRKRLFDAIENEKQEAVKARDESKKQTDIAKNALAQAEIEKQTAFVEKNKADSLFNIAEKHKKKVQAVLDKIYFYEGKFGLAYDKNERKFGFIDKDLNTKIAFQYEEALHFDYTGLAKVKKEGDYYLINTTGRKYKLATDITQLNADIMALDLRNKNLNDIPPSVFKHTQLKVLLLKGNKITKITEGMKALTNLLYLDLSQNEITTLENLDNLKTLQNFNISYNGIGKLEGLDSLKTLQNFNISWNHIYKLERLNNLKTLQYFNISGNHIYKLERLDNLKTLQNFNISMNQISKIEGLDNLKTLQYFNIYNNQISKIEGLDNLKTLQNFDISWNEITKLEGLDNLKKIKDIDIGGNSLSVEDINQRLKAMPNLEELSLQNLGLTTLPDAVLSLKQLKSLNLRNHQNKTKNNFSEAEQVEIKKLLPNCEITF